MIDGIGGPPPEYVAAGKALYARRERHARRLAEASGMSIEAARRALIKSGLAPEVLADTMTDAVMGLGVWWCTVHNDDLEVCTVEPLSSPYCAPVFTKAAQCAGCRVPEDQPHRSMCGRVMYVPNEGDVTEIADVPEGYTDPPGVAEAVAALRAQTEAPMPEPPEGAVPERDLLRDDIMNPDTDASHLAALGVRVTHSPETGTCGDQFVGKPGVLAFCTKGFGHVAIDEVHYDHRAKLTWRDGPRL